MTGIYMEIMSIQGTPVGGENPLPFFRDGNHHKQINYVEPFPAGKKEKHGYETGFRVLPYRLQDRFGRKKAPMQLKTIVMENDYLRAVFLPEAGGKLISLEDKKADRELLSRNPVFQPANLAIRHAWLSGGIEWNIGQLGHTFHTCSSVFAAVLDGNNGEKFLRIYEFERCKRLFWHIDFYLPEDSRVLYAYTRIVNPNLTDRPMYWWTNIAVPETLETRVFASAEEVIYLDQMGLLSQGKGYGYAKMPVLPCLPGKDFSYPYSCGFSTEYFFQCPSRKTYWEAAVYKEGELFFEVSTEKLRYRKMFCWGNHSGGKRWQEYLAEKGTAYVEIQGGLAPSQLHGLDMPAGAVWDWTQVFGGSSVQAEVAHQKDWYKAKEHVESRIREIIPERMLLERETAFRSNAGAAPRELLHTGSGWGALEVRRMATVKDDPPAGFNFPVSTLGEEQYPWLYLLENGRMPERDPGQLPGAWMTQEEWKLLLQKSLQEEKNVHWYALLHAGVMLMEEGDEREAERFWQESLKKVESPWAYRNLAQLKKGKGELSQAIYYMEKAMEVPGALSDPAIAQEYLELLLSAEKNDDAWKAYIKLPENLQSTEMMLLLAGKIAAGRGDYAFVRRLFERDYACIREGETTLSDLWFECEAFKLAGERGERLNNELLRHVRKTMTPPPGLDFRVIID